MFSCFDIMNDCLRFIMIYHDVSFVHVTTQSRHISRGIVPNILFQLCSLESDRLTDKPETAYFRSIRRSSYDEMYDDSSPNSSPAFCQLDSTRTRNLNLTYHISRSEPAMLPLSRPRTLPSPKKCPHYIRARSSHKNNKT